MAKRKVTIQRKGKPETARQYTVDMPFDMSDLSDLSNCPFCNYARDAIQVDEEATLECVELPLESHVYRISGGNACGIYQKGN